MFKRILFPTDGSEQANRALNYVIEFAGKFNSEIIVLHSYSMPLPEYIPFNYDTKELEEELVKNCKLIIDEAENNLKSAGLKVKSLIKSGAAGFNICRTVENEGCDLIIMGSRGGNLLKSYLIGSVSNYVIHHTNCPVTLIQ